MAIGPLEMNGILSRTQDYSILKQNMDNKPVIDQSNLQHQYVKELHDKQWQINQLEEVEKDEYRYDPKEKGNGSYSSQKRKQNKEKKKEEEKQDGKVVVKNKATTFDVTI